MPEPRRSFPIPAGLLLAATFLGPPAWAQDEPTLYERLGGHAAVTAISARFVAIAVADHRIAAAFADSDLDRLRSQLGDFLCMTADGPCRYQGRTMSASHAGLHLHEEAFDATVEDLERAMDEVGVGFRIQNALLARLAPMRRQIVTR